MGTSPLARVRAPYARNDDVRSTCHSRRPARPRDPARRVVSLMARHGLRRPGIRPAATLRRGGISRRRPVLLHQRLLHLVSVCEGAGCRAPATEPRGVRAPPRPQDRPLVPRRADRVRMHLPRALHERGRRGDDARRTSQLRSRLVPADVRFALRPALDARRRSAILRAVRLRDPARRAQTARALRGVPRDRDRLSRYPRARRRG